tara:strand:+ start:3850 stop:6225 length:2376 start_codon:yes stop_codon:yes gene_type:complete
MAISYQNIENPANAAGGILQIGSPPTQSSDPAASQQLQQQAAESAMIQSMMENQRAEAARGELLSPMDDPQGSVSQSMIPSVPSPMEAMPEDIVVQMNEGGLVSEARDVQSQGRYGDSMLVHMNPSEYDAMVQLGGLGGLVENKVTVNPQTGLPEMFSFKDILPTIVGVAGAAFGLPTWAVALGAGATTAVTTGDIGKGLLAGLGSFALGSLAGDLGGSAVANPSVGVTAGNVAANTGLNAATPVLTETGAGFLGGGSYPGFGGIGFGSGFGAETALSNVGQSLPVSGFGADALGSFNPATQSLSGFNVGGGAASSFDSAFGGGFSSNPALQTPVANRIVAGAANAPVPVSAGFNAGPASGPINFTGSGGAISSQNFPAANFQGNIAALDTANQAAGNMVNATDAAQNAAFSSAYKDAAFQNAPLSTAFDSAAVGPSKIDLIGEGISNIGQPGGVGYLDVAQKGILGAGATAGGMGLFDPEPLDYSGYSGGRRSYSSERGPVLNRSTLSPPDDYRPGIDPSFNYFAAAEGKRGELDTVYANSGIYGASREGQMQPQPPQGQTQSPARIQQAVMESAQQIASNAVPQSAGVAYSPYAALPATVPASGRPQVRMANGGVPEEQVMAGLMDVSPDEAKNNLMEAMAVPSADSEPQSVEERIIYDQAMLAVQGILENEAAQEAVREFIEVFGEDAYQILVESASKTRDEGGIIKPANGETTVAEGAIQGDDVIAGMIVDPETGEETANLRVGENEYIEPADSLSRRAMAAGLPPTPKNGAKVRSAEEDQLLRAYG